MFFFDWACIWWHLSVLCILKWLCFGSDPSAMERNLSEWWPPASTSWHSLRQGEDRLQWLAWNAIGKNSAQTDSVEKKTVYMLWFDGLFLSQNHLGLFSEFWKARKREVNPVSLPFPCCGWVVTTEHGSLCSHKSHHAHPWWLPELAKLSARLTVHSLCFYSSLFMEERHYNLYHPATLLKFWPTTQDVLGGWQRGGSEREGKYIQIFVLLLAHTNTFELVHLGQGFS